MSACEGLAFSTSATLTIGLVTWRNNPNGSMNDFGRKAVSAPGFIALALLATIETTVRGVLALLSLPFICCLPEKDRETVTYAFVAGTLFTFGTIIGNLTMFAKNFFVEKVDLQTCQCAFQPAVSVVTYLGRKHATP